MQDGIFLRPTVPMPENGHDNENGGGDVNFDRDVEIVSRLRLVYGGNLELESRETDIFWHVEREAPYSIRWPQELSEETRRSIVDRSFSFLEEGHTSEELVRVLPEWLEALPDESSHESAQSPAGALEQSMTEDRDQ